MFHNHESLYVREKERRIRQTNKRDRKIIRTKGGMDIGTGGISER
jgi:hypothetical protein